MPSKAAKVFGAMLGTCYLCVRRLVITDQPDTVATLVILATGTSYRVCRTHLEVVRQLAGTSFSIAPAKRYSLELDGE